MLIYELSFFNYFPVSSPDFSSYSRDAEAWLNFDLPPNLKRMPIFPITMGVVSRALPVGGDYLIAGKIFGIFLSLVSLWLIYLISYRFLKKNAFLVSFIVGINLLTLVLSVNPLLEMLLLTFVLWTIYLSLKNKKRAYLAAFLASLTRFEGAIMIPIITFKNIIYSKKKRLHLFLGALASLGIVSWMALSYYMQSLQRYFIQGIFLKPERNGLGLFKSYAASLINFIPTDYIESSGLWLLLGGLISLIFLYFIVKGFLYLLKNHFKETLSITLFFVGYTILHMIHLNMDKRHNLMILWILCLFLITGIFSSKLSNTVLGFRKKVSKLFLILVIITIVVVNIYFLLLLSKFFILYLGFLFFLYWFIKKRVKNFGFFIILLLILSLFVAGNIYSNKYYLEKTRYDNAEFRVVGEWFGNVAVETDVLVGSRSSYIRHYSGFGEDKVRDIGKFSSNNTEDFILELQQKNVTYIVYDTSLYGTITKTYRNYYYLKADIIKELNLADGTDKPHFKLVKRLVIGDKTALVYRFIP